MTTPIASQDLAGALARLGADLGRLPSRPELELDLAAAALPAASPNLVCWLVRTLLTDPSAPLPPAARLSLATRDAPGGVVEVALSGAGPPGARLEMVRELVRRGGGELVVEGQGPGTTVRLVLPARVRQVLLVDDDPMLRRALAMVLGRAGYDLLQAGDGAEALALAEGRRIDLVVSDLSMPRMGGLELAQALRARCPTLPVLLISGTLPAGPLPFPCLSKPITRPILLARVEELLGGPVGRAGNPSRRPVTPTPALPLARTVVASAGGAARGSQEHPLDSSP